MNEPLQSPSNSPAPVGVVFATDHPADSLQRQLDRLPEGITVVNTPATAGAVNEAFAQLAPADVVLLHGAQELADGWLAGLAAAATADTNTATASALADTGTPLAVLRDGEQALTLGDCATRVAQRTLRLRPRLRRAVGPCVYIRRAALDLVGGLDEREELGAALEGSFSRECLLAGLAHVAADDVLVAAAPTRAETAAPDREALAESPMLATALSAIRDRPSRLKVTLDVRALEGEITGTQVHILELARALARTGEVRLRLLVRAERTQEAVLSELRELPATELLDEPDVGPATPPDPVYHRPQQMFAAEDVALACALGERVVVSQLDLIAYRNPGYFPDADAWEDYRRASRHGLAAAARVVVFSEHTREELVSEGLAAPPERIAVVPPGLDHRRTPGSSRPSALPGEGFEDGFLLCLGTDFRHKNRLFALRLLNELRERHAWPGRLVLAGTHVPHGSSAELERAYLAEHAGLQGAVVDLGPVQEEEKAWLMAHAGAVLYPSVYEGFGLVPFESALAGVPCVFAAQSSLAEVAPPGTATIAPWDPRRSAPAVFALLTDAGARASHVERLALAAAAHTWDAAARAIVAVYGEAATAPAQEAETLARDAVQRERRLTAAHETVVERLIGERRHAQRMYDDLNAEVGDGLSLIGPHGALPDSAQRALLVVSSRPSLRRPLFGALGGLFLAGRALGRSLRGAARR